MLMVAPTRSNSHLFVATATSPKPCSCLTRPPLLLSLHLPLSSSNSITTTATTTPLTLTSPFFLKPRFSTNTSSAAASSSSSSSSSSSFPFHDQQQQEADKAKLAQVAKRLEITSRYFKRLGNLGFWGQLVCTVVGAVVIAFQLVATGKISLSFTLYANLGGIVTAFMSVFWSFGYIRLSNRLRRYISDPAKAPSRAEVINSLKNGIELNLLGMGAAVLGMQATVGLLVAKALTSSAIPYYQGFSPGSRPVLALDVFQVQASANIILSHFLGLLFSLELLRSVTLPPPNGVSSPKAV